MKHIDSIHNKAGHTLDEYKDVFTGLGCISDVIRHIKVDRDHKLVVHPTRRVPVILGPKVKPELQRMEQLGAIEMVHEATERVNSFATVTKPKGKL